MRRWPVENLLDFPWALEDVQVGHRCLKGHHRFPVLSGCQGWSGLVWVGLGWSGLSFVGNVEVSGVRQGVQPLSELPGLLSP